MNSTRAHERILPSVGLKKDDVVLVHYSSDFFRGVVVSFCVENQDQYEIQLLDVGKIIIANTEDSRYISSAIPVMLNTI